MYCMGFLYCLWFCFIQFEVFDFVFGNQIFYGFGYIFDGYVGIDVVLIEDIDMVGVKKVEILFCDFFDMFWLVVQVVFLVDIKFGCDYDFIVEVVDGLVEEFFVFVLVVKFCCVEECDV